MKRTLWVMRTAPDNKGTLKWLRQRGAKAIDVPVLETLCLRTNPP